MTKEPLLKTILFSNTEQWNAKSFFSTIVKSKYQVSSIGQHTIHITKKTKLFESPDESFKILGISNEIGMFDAYTELGKNINQPYIKVENGCLAYNPYRVNVGSIGIKTDSLKNEFISPAYVVFKCKETILPEYLYLVLKSSFFNRLIRENTTGSVRQTLSYDRLSSIKIPVPTIEEQNAIIKNHSESITTIRELENQINEKDKEIDSFILTTLGVSVNQNEFLKGGTINRLSLKSIFRWDAWSQKYSFCLTKYPFTEFSRIVTAAPLYGANEKAINEKSDIRYIRITDINEDGTLNDEFVSAKSVDKKYLLENNDFLIARSGNTVGKTFLYKSEFGKCIFAGYLIKYKLNTELIIPEYLLYYTKSSVFKAWIQNNQRIFGQPNINGQEYLNADIIVPEIEVQKDIVRKVNELRTQIQETKQQIAHISNENKKRFEEDVFGE
ncbi:MAG: restriction endonuclease subunit S [Eubacterium sp.]|nr:restriction endonuclease subunit S [Eubacterium sp.]